MKIAHLILAHRNPKLIKAVECRRVLQELFARKFSDDDLHLVERVEQMIRKKDYQYAGNLMDGQG
jgi:hypothetical protein